MGYFKLLNNSEPEKTIYYLIATALGIALLGIPYVRYIVYILPVLVIFIGLLLKCIHFNISRVNLPFIIILIASIPTVHEYDFNSLKKLYFIATYTSIFLYVDFSRIKINFYYFGFVLIIVFLFQVATGLYYTNNETINYSIIDSKSTFESTLSFPFAILACFYILQSRWLLSSLYVLFVFISLKRIAIISIMLTLIVKLIPKVFRSISVNPYLITTLSICLTYLTIYFSYGGIDEEIKEIFDRSSNDLSKGRQGLWHAALTGLNYQFNDFLIYGSGIGKVITRLQHTLGIESILLHNDLLSILLEYGFIIFIIFVFLISYQKSLYQRVMAAALIVLFFTDNVMIYQHVMITYFLVQSQLVNKKPRFSQ